MHFRYDICVCYIFFIVALPIALSLVESWTARVARVSRYLKSFGVSGCSWSLWTAWQALPLNISTITICYNIELWSYWLHNLSHLSLCVIACCIFLGGVLNCAIFTIFVHWIITLILMFIYTLLAIAEAFTVYHVAILLHIIISRPVIKSR